MHIMASHMLQYFCTPEYTCMYALNYYCVGSVFSQLFRNYSLINIIFKKVTLFFCHCNYTVDNTPVYYL